MDIKVPPAKPFVSQKGQNADVRPTLGQTTNALWGDVFNPIATELQTYTRNDFEPDSVDRVESYIERNPMSNEDARFLRRNGIGSEVNFNATLNSLSRTNQYKETIARSSTANVMIGHPTTAASILIPFAGSIGFKGLQAGLTKAPAFEGAVQAAARPITASRIAKIGAIDAGVTELAYQAPSTLSAIGISDDPSQELRDAALVSAAAPLLGATVGYGLGRIMGAPARQSERTRQGAKGMREWLSNVRNVEGEAAASRSADGDVGSPDDFTQTGKWFNESPLSGVVPTPVRTELSDPDIPMEHKRGMLELAGDNGSLLVANKHQGSVGNSVYMEAGRRDGDWFSALEVIDNNYREVSPRGNASVLGIPVGAYVETIRRKLGKDSFAPSDWYEHIGDLYMSNTPYEKMTPQEAASVQAVESFMLKYKGDLQDVGLIGTEDIFVENLLKQSGRQGEMISVTNSIIAQNRRWMTGASEKLRKQTQKKIDILESLRAQASSRGLSEKQLELQKKLESEIEGSLAKIDKFEEQLELINNARSVEEIGDIYKQLDLTPSMFDALGDLSKAMNDTRVKIQGYLDAIEFRKAKYAGKPSGLKRHFPRFYNRRAIEADREGFFGILAKHFRENPEDYVTQPDGTVKYIKYSTDPAEIAKRVNQTIDNILGQTDEDMLDAIFTGFGRSSPLMSRRLDIDNALIADFLVKDVKSVMIAYTSRVAPKIEFHKRVRNPKTGGLITLEDHLINIRADMAEQGVPEKKIDRYISNYVGAYDQIVGTNRHRVDAIDTKIAEGLRNVTTWTFLSSSGIAAFGDAASLFMDHEMKVIGKGVLSLMDDVSLGLGKRELNLAGEALEQVKGTTMLRYQESLSNDMFNNGLSNKLNNAFFNLNLLGPVTIMMKSMDGLLRGHTIIEASERFLAGKATKFEKEFLARYNISEDMMRRFGEMPTEKSQGGLILPNTDAWTDEDALLAFRNALKSGVMNRIIMGTPADKPLVMGGVAYIPESVASKLPFELPIDQRVKGYRRAESGLLALPFVFYTYTMGALTKITGNYASGSVRNNMAHIAIAMGLGAAIVKFRTPDYVWDNMDPEDKIMRAFDFSGLAAIYSDMTYRGIAMAHELGIESSFPIQPKFSGDVDPLGAAISIGGAPADYAYGVTKAMGDMLSGNYNEGATDLVRLMPLIDAMSFGGVLEGAAQGAVDYTMPNRP